MTIQAIKVHFRPSRRSPRVRPNWLGSDFSTRMMTTRGSQRHRPVLMNQ